MKKIIALGFLMLASVTQANEPSQKLDVRCIINNKSLNVLADGFSMGPAETYIFNINPRTGAVRKKNISNQKCMVTNANQSKLAVGCVINDKNRNFQADGLVTDLLESYLFNMNPQTGKVSKKDITNQHCIVTAEKK